MWSLAKSGLALSKISGLTQIVRLGWLGSIIESLKNVRPFGLIVLYQSVVAFSQILGHFE